MSRSNSPLALSVVTLTEPGDVALTFSKITEFDDRDFGFNHNQTWAAMPHALRGVLDPTAVEKSFAKAPVRVQRCIVALCEFGQKHKLETKRFQDYPDAGLRTVESIDWDPDVEVRVKASCWYVEHGKTILPVLQPRKAGLTLERLAVYRRLVRQAYCQGDWLDALVNLIDLAGDDDKVTASLIPWESLPEVSDKLIAEYVQTFVEAKKLVDKRRAEKVKKSISLSMAQLLGID